MYTEERGPSPYHTYKCTTHSKTVWFVLSVVRKRGPPFDCLFRSTMSGVCLLGSTLDGICLVEDVNVNNFVCSALAE